MSDSDQISSLSPKRTLKEMLLFLMICFSILSADIISKYLSFAYVAGEPVHLDRQKHSDPLVQAVPEHPPVKVIPKVLSLRLTLNRGAVFGIGQGKRWVFIVVSLMAIVIIGWAFWSSPQAPQGRIYRVLLSFILAGALGNLYDRIMYGGVRDMLYLFPDVHLPFGWRWPNEQTLVYPWIFNVADVALVIGVLAMMLQNFMVAHEEKKMKKKTPAKDNDSLGNIEL